MDVRELIEILYPGPLLEEEKEKVMDIINDFVDWNKRHRVHDWKNYVPELVRDTWTDLAENEKLLVYYFAKQQADKENWD